LTPPLTSTPSKSLDFQWGFFIVGQIMGQLGQKSMSNYLLFHLAMLDLK